MNRYNINAGYLLITPIRALRFRCCGEAQHGTAASASPAGPTGWRSLSPVGSARRLWWSNTALANLQPRRLFRGRRWGWACWGDRRGWQGRVSTVIRWLKWLAARCWPETEARGAKGTRGKDAIVALWLIISFNWYHVCERQSNEIMICWYC